MSREEQYAIACIPGPLAGKGIEDYVKAERF